MFNVKRPVAGTIAAVLTLVFSSHVSAQVRLPRIIGDNMVLQRGREIPIWGWAEPGERIGVTFDGRTVETTAGKDGKWAVRLPAVEIPPAEIETGKFTPREMVVKGSSTITLGNILIGDVWVCSGQSNMVWPVSRSDHARKETAQADFPGIRLFTVPRVWSEDPRDDVAEAAWAASGPETVATFSAVAYYFGRTIHREQKIPVGLINSSFGGTPSEAWTSGPTVTKDPGFATVRYRMGELLKDYPARLAAWEKQMAKWRETNAAGGAQDRPNPPRKPLGPGDPRWPCGLYNAMVHPLIPFSITGVIWYQGEHNAGHGYEYRTIFPLMIGDWRRNWGQGDFPFVFVQLTNYMREQREPSEGGWAELREAQLLSLSTVKNTGMAVTVDIGDANNIHPGNKQDVGRRLALWALKNVYGVNVAYSGPIYKKMELEGDRIRLHFDHTDGGLVARGGELKGFAIAAADGKFVWADAKIDGATVVVSSASVKNPVAVRYAWASNPFCTLFNQAGLPASPFRTDTWELDSEKLYKKQLAAIEMGGAETGH